MYSMKMKFVNAQGNESPLTLVIDEGVFEIEIAIV